MKTITVPESGIKKLKINVTNIKSVLLTRKKSMMKISANKDRLDAQAEAVSDRSSKEKGLEKKSSPLKRIGKKAVKKIGTTAKSMFQRILTLAMPLITAIIVNNIESIAEGIMTFYENNKGIFDGIGKAVSVLGKGFMMLVNFISGMEDNKDAKKMKELDSSITNLKGHLDKIKPLEELGKKLSTESTKAASKAPGGSGVKEDNKLTVSSETSSLMDAVISNDPEKLEKLSTKPENTSDSGEVPGQSAGSSAHKMEGGVSAYWDKVASERPLNDIEQRRRSRNQDQFGVSLKTFQQREKGDVFTVGGVTYDTRSNSESNTSDGTNLGPIKGKDNTLDMKGLVSKSNKRKTDTVIITNVVEKVVRV
jgi:hypothetical protein